MGARPSAIPWLLAGVALAAACGGRSRRHVEGGEAADAGASSVGGTGSGGSGASGGNGANGATELPDTLVQLIVDGPWEIGQETAGIAVDSQGVIYLADAEHVFRIEGTTVSVHLELADVSFETGQGDVRFQDLDITADDTLFVAAGGMLLRSVEAHHLNFWTRFDDDATVQSRAHLGAIGPGHALVVDDEGMQEITDDGSVRLYGVDQLARFADCATEDLATAPSGVFLYLPGCDESPLLRGYAGGVGVSVLYKAGLPDPKPISASNFVCSARDPSGGFYVVTRHRAGFEPLLYHVGEDASPNDDALYLPTTPSFASQQQLTWSDRYAFDFCSLAVAPNGTLVYQTFSQLWLITP